MATNLRLQSAALVVLLLVSSIGAPATAQDGFVDPKQPSVDNPHMHLYGTSDLSNCFMHFDGNDSTGSAEEGYGEQVWPEQNGQQIEMDYTCRLQENFKQDMYLQENSTINIILNFNIDARGQCDANTVCENLNLTLYKGGIELAIEAMKKHPEVAEVQDSGCFVLWWMALNENARPAVAKGREWIEKAQKAFPDHDSIKRRSRQALKALDA